MRKAIFWLHLAAGLVAGTIVLVLSVTGLLLAFEPQIVEVAERGFRTSPPGAAPLGADALLARVVEARPDIAPAGLTLRSDPAAPATLSVGRETTLFVDPYTGRILGEGAKQARGFFHAVTDWHRWLAREGAGRATGRAITDACNLAFFVLIVSGLYLWLPRWWSRKTLAAVSIPSLRLRGKARDFNWHNALGLWCAPALFFIALTGVLISYPWATNLLYRATGSEPPAPRAGPGGPGGRPGGPGGGQGEKTARLPENLDALFARAAAEVPGWKSISARFAPSPAEPVPFVIERGARGRPDLRTSLSLDPRTAEIVKAERFSSYNLGRQLRTWGRWVHTGEAGGLPGQVVAALASAGAAVLVWTGFALSWRRFFGRKSPARAVAADAEPVQSR